MNIVEIYKKGEISVRSYNVCRYNKLNSISDLKTYYNKNKSFERLRNCGQKSNIELINICHKYKEHDVENGEIEIKKENPLKSVISNLTRVQREVINSFIFVNTNNLSVRSKNAISLYLKNNLKVKGFSEKILLNNNFDAQNLQNVGAKCVPEIKIYISIIKEFIVETSQIKDEKYLISLKNKYLIQQTFDIHSVPDELLETESIFQISDYLFNKNAFFDETQTYIINKSLKLFENQNILTLDEISEEVNLSRERVRQIRKHCIDKLYNKLKFVQNFNEDLYLKYDLDISSNYIEINMDVIDKINKTNNTQLSRGFINYILSAYLKDSFELVGNYEDVLQLKYFNSRHEHNWNNLYLVKNELASQIDFRKFINDISKRTNDRIEESYSFNFKSYLSKFLTNNNTDVLDLLFPVCEKIINEEFEVFLDLEENINFKRNTIRHAHEYAYEALENLGKPSKVKDILKKVIELHPNYDTDEMKIRASMKRKNGFVPIGRKSVFGLKKWESELKNFKGGTIRDIVQEYLMQFSVPKHISDITEYVLKFRPKSNQYSILQNLKLDESGLYIFFKDSHIGLATKKYQCDLKKISKVKKADKKTWEERFENLQNFVFKEKRLPFSSNVPKKEIKLYHWYNVQKSKQNKGKLPKTKKDKLNSLLTKYPSINGKRRLNSNEKYKELISFVSINRRLPSANKYGEENLYQFFYKQRRLFDENELDSNEQIKYIEVAKLLENIKYGN